ncbi:MAG: citrate/2-methylcitrate synthase [Microthrixaceae bacterium]
MSTYVRSDEAARILGVSKATLYAYVSRGRVGRTTAADGRTSLFAVDELEAVAGRGRRAPLEPRPTIDVQIASAITVLGEGSVRLRGHDLAVLVAEGTFEDVAELLWTDTWSPGTTWPSANRSDLAAVSTLRQPGPDTSTGGHAPARQPGLGALAPVPRLAVAAHLLDAAHPGDDAPAAARRLLAVAPTLVGSRRTSGQFAQRLAAAWRSEPSGELVAAVDLALSLLADHELATSTLAVRVAASVRASAYGALAAGLATVDGALHGSASSAAAEFLAECAAEGAAAVVRRHRADRRRIPGLGHKVYRAVDPRFELLMPAVRDLAAGDERLEVIDDVLAEVGRTVPHQPNIDLALGALAWVAGLDADVPIFAIARIAGWAAHYTEELNEAPVRYRGLARTS